MYYPNTTIIIISVTTYIHMYVYHDKMLTTNYDKYILISEKLMNHLYTVEMHGMHA